MASSSTHIQDEEQTQQQHSSPQDIKVNIRSYSDYFNRFLTLSFWVSRSFRKLHFTSRFSESTCFTGHQYSGTVKNNYVVSASFCSSSSFLEEEMCPAVLSSSEPGIMRRESDGSSEESSSASPAFWRLNGIEPPDFTSNSGGERAEKESHSAEKILENKGSTMSEMEMMKERLSKLLLGEDMSGCGNGVSTALTISNAITNLCATLFGQLWRLERTPLEKKAMWRREMECLLSVTDHIVELEPSLQTFSDGSKLEVMTCRPRSDVYINLPALRKIDNMLLEILDSFEDTEFWYVDQGILTPEVDGTSSSREGLRQEEKWWLPIPRVPPDGLSDDFWRNLQNKRDRTNQIFKAAMAINAIALAEMEVPESYLSALPKNARTTLGDTMYRYIISDQFFPDHLLDYLDLSSEHQAIEIANRVEASIFIWRNRTSTKPMNSKHTRSSSKSSWDLMKELMVDSDKRELLADRAEGLLHCLKQRFPGLPQTTLDMYKLQFNKDVGKAILESYSRVLESLAFNIMARIDDVFYVNSLTKQRDKLPSKNNYLGIMDHKKGRAIIPLSAPLSSTPYKTAFTTPSFSPTRMFSPVKGDQCSPFTINAKVNVKRALSDYFGTDGKGKELKNLAENLGSSSSRMTLEASAAQSGREYELAGGLRKLSQGELAVEK